MVTLKLTNVEANNLQEVLTLMLDGGDFEKQDEYGNIYYDDDLEREVEYLADKLKKLRKGNDN